MKELIVIIGTILLGTIIFNMLVGEDDSLKAASKDGMINSTLIFQEEYR